MRIPVAVLCFLTGWATSTPALAQVMYWTSDSGQSIQRSVMGSGTVEDLLVGEPDPVGLALDLDAGRMYWAQRTGDIRRANMNGSGAQTLVDLPDGVGPRGVAIDPAGGKIYWACDNTNVIQRANLDGSDVETIVSPGPAAGLLGVSLDRTNGKMYWVDTTLGSISRANLDGTAIETVISIAGSTPYYMDIDTDSNHIYWTDYYYSSIQRANLDGTGHVALINTAPYYPIGIALDVPNDLVYWTLIDGSIQRAHLDGTGVEEVVTNLPAVWALELDLLRHDVPATTPLSVALLACLILAGGMAVLRQPRRAVVTVVCAR